MYRLTNAHYNTGAHMAYEIKAFGVLPEQTNNVQGQVATVGELSTHSRTFAYDKLLYANDLFPSNELVIFSSKNNGAVATPPADVTDKVQDVLHNTYTNYDNSTPYLTWLAAAYGDISDITAGEIILQGGKYIPRWVKFTMTVGADTATITTWLSDVTFQAEYDEYEIIIVPPMEPVTALYAPHASAKLANDAVDLNSYISRAETVRADRPFTDMRSFALHWNDPSDNNLSFTTNWMVLGYGPESTRQDNMLQAVRDYLIANTPNTIEEWRDYLPELLAEDTVIIIPVWNRPSVTAGPNSDTLYSSISDYGSLLTITNQIQPALTNDEIVDYLEHGSSLYKSLGVIFLGSGRNSAGIRKFTDKYPKYSVVSMNDQSINALPVATVDMLREVELLLTQADLDTGSNTLPTAMSRVVDGNFTFIHKTFDGVVFRVVTRESYKAAIS